MKRMCFAAIAAALIMSIPAQAEIVDGVLAVVDGEPILQSDLIEDIASEMDYLMQQGGGNAEQTYNDLMNQALQNAIDNKILLRLARQRIGLQPEFAVTDDEVEERIQNIAKLYENREAFLADLAKSGETMFDIRERVRNQLLAIRMGMSMRAIFEKEAIVTESQVAQYYEDNRSEFERPERVRLRHIFMSAGESEPDQARTRAQMEQLHDELEAGANFGEIAAAHTEAAEEGRLGWVGRGDLVEALDTAVFGLAEKDYSGVIEAAGGFHIFLAEEKQEAGLASLDEVRTEIEPILREQMAQERYDDWIADRRKESRVQVFR